MSCVIVVVAVLWSLYCFKDFSVSVHNVSLLEISILCTLILSGYFLKILLVAN